MRDSPFDDGLDLASLMMDIEDAFGVNLSDDIEVKTVGDVIAVVRRQLALVPQSGPSALGLCFRKIRDGLLRQLPAGTAGALRIRPSTVLSDHWDRRQLAGAWRDLELDCGLRLPGRVPHRFAWIGFLAFALGCAPVFVLFYLLGPHWSLGLPIGPPVGFVAISIAWAIRSNSIPDRIQTVGDLTRAAWIRNARRLRRLGATYTDLDVAETIRRIIAENAGVPLERVHLETNLVTDLA